jgi:chorismate mutase
MCCDDKLSKAREQIDSLDDQIIKILAKRFEIVDQIIDLKVQNGFPLTDENREHDIINRLSKSNPYVDKELIEYVYQRIFDYSKRHACK